MILKTLAVIGIASISFTACKKEKAKTTSEQIVGVWHLASSVYNTHYGGTDHIENDPGGQTDVYEFMANGILNATVMNSTESPFYSISADNKLEIIGGETYDIKKLDGHNLVLYYKSVSGADEYLEITLTFNR